MLFSTKTSADLGWDALLEHLAARAHTQGGQAAARALAPAPDIDHARARLEEIAEARALHDVGEPLPLGGVKPLDEALTRAGKGGALDPPLLRDVASTLLAGARVKRHLLARPRNRLLARAALISELDEVSGPIEDAFEPGEGTLRLSDRASAALPGLRRRAQKVREELETRMTSLLDAPHLRDHLQDHFATQREDRFVLPVRIDARAKVRGIVHGTSQSGQTVFVEPEEIVDLNNRLKLAELEVAEEERRILAELSARVAEVLGPIRINLEILTALDLLDASARLAIDLKASTPELAPAGAGPGEARLDLRRARHPLMVLSGRECVPSDIVVGKGQTLIVSGPNAGGKTVALKTSGLAALMARAALPVAAQEGSQVPFFEAVFTDVGDDQSLERNLSTFSAHVMQLGHFLAQAGPGALVLLDEVAVGTDPDQGAALAQAVLEALAERGATAVVTTHYDRLKALAVADPRFLNAAVGFDVERLAPTYELHLGVPGASGALVVARKLGLEEKVCARAAALLGDARGGVEELVLELDRERRRIADERAQAASERAAAERARDDAERKAAQAGERLERARRGAHDEAVATLKAARDELDRTRTVLRRSGGRVTPADVQEARREIDAAARVVAAQAPPPPAPPGRAATADELKPGARVWVQRLGGAADVVEAPKGRKLKVQAGPLKVQVTLDEVRIVAGARPEPSARARRGHNAFDDEGPAAEQARSVRGRWPTLDVRGERADAAVARAEKFLDDALRSSREGVLVVHGHGTGALRDTLRQRLREFPGVAEVRPGLRDEGGDGVTVVTLS